MGASDGLGRRGRLPANRLRRPAHGSTVLTGPSRRAEKAAEVLAVAGAFGRGEARSMFPPNTQRFEEGAQPSSRLPVTYRNGFERPSHRGKTLLTPPARATLREMSLRVTLGTPAICWSITPNWVDRQTGIITG